MTTHCDSSCKHYGRCDYQPDDDCYEPKSNRPSESQSGVRDLCVRALLTGDAELQALAKTLIHLQTEPLANRVALFAVEMHNTGLF